MFGDMLIAALPSNELASTIAIISCQGSQPTATHLGFLWGMQDAEETCPDAVVATQPHHWSAPCDL